MTRPFFVAETTPAQEKIAKQPFQTRFQQEEQLGPEDVKVRVPVLKFGKKFQHEVTIGDVEFFSQKGADNTRQGMLEIAQRASLSARELRKLFKGLGFDVDDPPINIRWRLDAFGSVYKSERDQIVLGDLDSDHSRRLHTIAHEMAHFYTDVVFGFPDLKKNPEFVPLAEGFADALAILIDPDSTTEGAEIVVETKLKVSEIFSDTKGFLKEEEYWLVGFVTKALIQRNDERLIKALQLKIPLTKLIPANELDQLQIQVTKQLRAELGLEEPDVGPQSLEEVLQQRRIAFGKKAAVEVLPVAPPIPTVT